MTDRRLDAYDFALPEAQIAQRPADRRDASRMLVLHRATGEVEDRRFADLPAYVRPGDAVVMNDTRVVPARLVGRRAGGGHAELFLVRRLDGGAWEALARPGRKLREGAVVDLDGGLSATVEAVDPESGRRHVRLARDEAPFPSPEAEDAALDAVGRLPLPPYIARDAPDAADLERYQTVYAKARGAVAAPTAGLHFTPAVLDALRAGGARLAEVTLHVGYGTFEPVKVDDLAEHRVAAETVEVGPEAVRAVHEARTGGGRVLAVGTTTTRALEAAAEDGMVAPFSGPTDLTVTPGYRFRAVDALLTNFHLPRSSLLVLTATFGGREAVLRAYRHAVEAGYRFYSYGDCMLIL